LLINPAVFLFFVFGLSYLFKEKKKQIRFCLAAAAVLSVILYANIVFSRFFQRLFNGSIAVSNEQFQRFKGKRPVGNEVAESSLFFGHRRLFCHYEGSEKIRFALLQAVSGYKLVGCLFALRTQYRAC